MGQIFSLLSPGILGSMPRGPRSGYKKWAFFLFMGIVFWAGIFLVSLRVLLYFKSIEGLGDILAFKLLSMMLITIFSLLVFSSILTSLSRLYLARDLPLVHSLPVAGHKIFTARWIQSTMDSSWMVILYTLPVFISFGIIYKKGIFFYCTIAAVLLLISMTASAFSAIIVMASAMVVPAGRIRTIFILLGIILFLVLFIAFRMLRPERLVNPEVFATTMQYLKALNTPNSPFYPTTWAFDAVKGSLTGESLSSAFNLMILFTGTGVITLLGIIVSDLLYFKGVSRTQAAGRKLAKAGGIRRQTISRLFSGPVWAFSVKEIKTFFRDQTQWSQLFLILGLVVVYLYNFSVLPLDKAPIKTIYLQNLLSFLNLGLAGFVLIAVTARFAYPAVSMETEAFWLVKISPVHEKTFLWIKFFVYLFPLLLLSLVLILVTNLMLNATGVMMAISIGTVFILVPGVVAMGVGMGAFYPDFKSENPAQAVSSLGGFLFMVIAGAYVAVVILLEAGPVYSIFMAGIRGRSLTGLEVLWIGIAFTIAAALAVLAVILPMKIGIKRLVEMPV